jgi:ribonucleoside-diphosphate reductase alpha chain
MKGSIVNQIEVNRYFTKGEDPYIAIKWEERTARITNFKGEVIFEQKGVRVPKSWSVTATNIVVSKYFYGMLGTPERETGVDQLVRRVVKTITGAGIAQGYFDNKNAEIFANELAFLLLNQYGAFNSPVWFNVGCDQYEPNAQARSWHWGPMYPDSTLMATVHGATGYKNPQCSACFINSVGDSMEEIMALARTEALLFKFGSGTGTNFSPLRSSKESVSGGGVASGPLSFMKGLDAFAGVIKSGGKTRRAAKMAILDIEHPDIVDFIECKLLEDKKAQALMREGYDGTSGPDSPAYASVFYQNANNSVRVSDQFMYAVENDLNFCTLTVKTREEVENYRARDLMHKIAKATWECGDPGMQFDDTINRWHTCKESGRINASNPCSEYMFLDNSACNLASLNLLKYLRPDGTFDVKAYEQAVTLFTIAQDILIDLSGYPTESIAKNSHDYRPLGLGYANLGALLMALGLPYDSDAGRNYAAVLTAIMTGRSYATSAFMAENLAPIQPSSRGPAGETGACPGWFANKEEFLDVIRMHNEALDHIDRSTIPNDLFGAAVSNWKTAYDQGFIHGYRNAQVSVLAPTGTIGFLMDCDTTGIEPELALVKYKKLVGGGQLKIVNETVERALAKLDYSKLTIDLLIKYIDEHGSLEGSGILLDQDLPVFDTAFKPFEGTRFIHYMGHIKMMAATQPFLSGAISKTVNMPNEATVEEIEEAYMQAWRLGLKAVAIYRDGSKSNQVLVTKKDDASLTPTLSAGQLFESGVAEALQALGDDDLKAPPRAVRHRLPDTRPAVTHKFAIAGHEGYLTVGLYEHGQPGEIFIAMAKEGSTISGFMDSFALVFSIALQHGVPLETLVQKLSHTRFEPSGWTGDPQIGYAKSIMDYVARWLEHRFLKPEQGKLFPDHPIPELVIEDEAPRATGGAVQALSAVMSMTDAPACQVCGCIMIRNGACYKCLECGSSSGCS